MTDSSERFARFAPISAVFVALACGGPSFDGAVYRNDELAFRVGPVPQTWRQIEVSEALVARNLQLSQQVAGIMRRDGLADWLPAEAQDSGT